MQFFWHIVAMICMSIPNILGFNLIFGKGKIFHFGPIGVSTVATYGVFVPLMHGFSYPSAIAIGFVLTMIISLLFAWLALRLEPDAFGVMAIAIHLSLLAVVINWISLTRGTRGLPDIPRFFFLQTTQSFALFTFIIALLWILFLFVLHRGSFGRSLDALAEQLWYAGSLGIDRRWVTVIAFLIGGLGALITNVIYCQYVFLVHPSDLNFPVFIFFVMVVVAGKPGSVPGVLCSLILLTLLREGMRFLPIPSEFIGSLRLLLFGLILFVAVWVRRDTLFPKARSV